MRRTNDFYFDRVSTVWISVSWSIFSSGYISLLFGVQFIVQPYPRTAPRYSRTQPGRGLHFPGEKPSRSLKSENDLSQHVHHDFHWESRFSKNQVISTFSPYKQLNPPLHETGQIVSTDVDDVAQRVGFEPTWTCIQTDFESAPL